VRFDRFRAFVIGLGSDCVLTPIDFDHQAMRVTGKICDVLSDAHLTTEVAT
jgi:hypothetical protein